MSEPMEANPRGDGPSATDHPLIGRWFDRIITPIVLTACLVAGLDLRTDGLDARGMWFDEAYSWRIGQYGPSEMCERLRQDNSPPLHFLAMKYWAQVFGDSPIGLRSLSVVAGLVTVLGVYLFTQALVSGPFADPVRISPRERAWAPLLAAALVAVNPLQVRYGWEARQYALGAALAVLSAWTLVRAADPDRPRWGRWLLFAAVTTPLAYTHNFALVAIAVEAGVLGWWLCERSGGAPARVFRQPALAPALAAFGLMAAGFAPWIPYLRDQLAFPYSRSWISPLTTYTQLYVPVYQLFADAVGPDWPANQQPGPARVTLAAAALVAGAVWRSRWVDAWPLALGIGPVLAMVALSVAGTPVLVSRYLIFGQPFLLVVLALAVARIRRPALFALAAVTAVSAEAYWSHDMTRRMDWVHHTGYRGAGDHIAAQATPGEYVLCADAALYFSMRYYLRDRDWVYGIFPSSGAIGCGNALEVDREFLAPQQIADRVGGRVWVVDREQGGRWSPPTIVPPSWQSVSVHKFSEGLGMDAIVVIAYKAPATPIATNGKELPWANPRP